MKLRHTRLLTTLIIAVALLLGSASLLAAASTTADKGDTSWRFHDIVGVEFVKKNAVMPKPENVLIIDSRPKRAKYDKGYIPTAINIPDRNFDKMIDKLPADKNTLLIFYCGGPT
ncbi:MAG: rhodanese-like domain-containing protein [Deltaproteobacteria bacterium]|nr:rhodanese-like domain-containing protein [Deltaproteobacteria bacterium]